MIMEWEDYIQMGLNGKAPLKIIVCGSIECAQEGKIGVVSVVYVTTDRDAAEQKVRIPHYPAIEIVKRDLA